MRTVLNLGLEDEFDITYATDRTIYRTEYPGRIRLQTEKPTEGNPGKHLSNDDMFNGCMPLVNILVLLKSTDRVMLINTNDETIGNFKLSEIPYNYLTRLVLEISHVEDPSTYKIKLSNNNYASVTKHEKDRIIGNIEHLIASAIALGIGEEVEKTITRCFK